MPPLFLVIMLLFKCTRVPLVDLTEQSNLWGSINWRFLCKMSFCPPFLTFIPESDGIPALKADCMQTPWGGSPAVWSPLPPKLWFCYNIKKWNKSPDYEYGSGNNLQIWCWNNMLAASFVHTWVMCYKSRGRKQVAHVQYQWMSEWAAICMTKPFDFSLFCVADACVCVCII